jgi:hypothetical protein
MRNRLGERGTRRLTRLAAAVPLLAAATGAAAAAHDAPAPFGIPVEFFLFAATLIGVAVFHRRTLEVALTGLASIALYKLVFTGFKTGAGWTACCGTCTTSG